MRQICATSVLVIVSFLHLAEAGHKCVWVHGRVKCNKDSAKETNVEVRVYDRDSFSFMKIIDPDDLMGYQPSSSPSMTNFQLDGCGDDFDWIPGVVNDPEPYLQILHYCNSEKGELMVLPEFNVFVPNTYEVGTIELDAPEVAMPPLRAGNNSVVRGGRRAWLQRGLASQTCPNTPFMLINCILPRVSKIYVHDRMFNYS